VNGKYLIKGKSYEMLRGSRAQVYHGTAYKTSGDLKKSDLVQNKRGRIVSAAKYKSSKQKGKNNLFNKGYSAKKGRFGAVRNGVTLSHKKTHHRRRHRSMRGGDTHTPDTSTQSHTTTSSHDTGGSVETPMAVKPMESQGLYVNSAAQIGGKSRHKKGGTHMSRKKGGTHMSRKKGGTHMSKSYKHF